jgi:WD40 repeat protein
MNFLEISQQSRYAVGGFSDSSGNILLNTMDSHGIHVILLVRLWDVKKRADDSTKEYVKLTGHFGPVYSGSFSPDNKYLLTSSEDKSGIHLLLLDYSIIFFYSETLEHRGGKMFSCIQGTSLSWYELNYAMNYNGLLLYSLGRFL